MAKITGEYPPIERVVTPYYSLNRALSNGMNVGWPMTAYEITGFGGVGKSTVVSSILGLISQHYKKNFIYAPIEPIDRDLLNSILDSVSFEQEAKIIFEKTDEETIDKFLEQLRDEKICGGVFDSLSAISPIAEVESSSADMNMGRRARLSGVLARGLVHLNRFRESPVTTILISHIATSMSMTPTNTGSSTTGGETKKNLSKVRIKLRKMPEPTMYEFEENCFIIEGNVEKFNFGKDKRKFYVAILGGKGIHTGMTALYDCKMLKMLSTGKSVKLGTESFGSMKSIVAKAHDGDDKFFQPFIDALKNPSSIGKVEQESNDGSDWEEDAE